MRQIDNGAHHTKGAYIQSIRVECTWWHSGDDSLRAGQITSIFSIDASPFRLQIDITPEQARQLGNALLSHANDVEAAIVLAEQMASEDRRSEVVA